MVFQARLVSSLILHEAVYVYVTCYKSCVYPFVNLIVMLSLCMFMGHLLSEKAKICARTG